MRVTQSMLTQQFLYNLSNISQQIQTDQNESSTGKLLNEPSDNPLAVSQDMAIRATLAQSTAYQGVITNGLAWMNNTSSTIQNMITTLQSVQANVTEALSSTSANAADLQALTTTTQQLVNQIYDDVNASQSGSFLFSGTQTNVAASDIASGTLLTTGNSTSFYEAPGSGNGSSGVSQSAAPQPIASSLQDPNGLLDANTTYKLVLTASSIQSDGSIQSGTIQLETQSGTVVASGTIPSGSSSGATITLSDTNGGSLSLTLGNVFQVSPGASGTLSYQQTDVLAPSAGAASKMNYEVSQGVAIPVNVTAADLFHTVPPGASGDLQSTLANIVNTLSAMTQEASSGSTSSQYQSLVQSLQSYFSDLQANTNYMTSVNADLGTRIQSMTAVQNQMSTYVQSLTTQQGNLENADMATVLTKYSTVQTVYEAALQIGAQILLPSLLNYLPNG
ncbi:hypothetical protein JI721_11275 [Alicyclobacillus cycloheptanicus]|uniref:Flagellin n=1 Tax=Alicyclobacillus cycloheptanicus TaxID=1457 RepID=A0ABT9XLS8_9BACL|nr:flagellin [Alicyclobacillus cycloheptanicus]MDQ0190666.1 flagellin-like hook-associated protein FlgL [Alicyclobacillus cycloheptanicus]WDM00316.1 hypothetical protein JI721_11275 [Alicyclobacillus cycloheptanicus]